MLMNSPVLGMLLTIVSFQIGLMIKKKTQSDLANPLLIAMILIISFLLITHTPYNTYKIGGDMIHFFLSPLTVALGLMLYRQRHVIEKYFFSLIIGICSGIFASFFTLKILGDWFQLPQELIHSLYPKSITTPMAISLSEMIGGYPSITVIMVIITGITGAFFAPFMLKFFPFLNSIACGIGIGTSSHAIGTSKALEMGETEGALSGTAIGLCGILTVIIVPFLIKLFQ
ncbi:LrgB family protein [Fusibacter ferrireducens]|uniref:LrgB family protein n=1 Tax=Fusibacter ferrireducens TaxID=2785058 RepID=A0ABR9ZXY1_9FIRM|nr:LrgB family protein [Fusibacter ferrireducens]MBF4695320.1 LrgB family protein [Fusibacter ferrireducens]